MLNLAQELKRRLNEQGVSCFFLAHLKRGAVSRNVMVINMTIDGFENLQARLTPEEAQKKSLSVEFVGGQGEARVCELEPIR